MVLHGVDLSLFVYISVLTHCILNIFNAIISEVNGILNINSVHLTQFA